jgi:hypothetical protein
MAHTHRRNIVLEPIDKHQNDIGTLEPKQQYHLVRKSSILKAASQSISYECNNPSSSNNNNNKHILLKPIQSQVRIAGLLSNTGQ